MMVLEKVSATATYRAPTGAIPNAKAIRISDDAGKQDLTKPCRQRHRPHGADDVQIQLEANQKQQ